MTTQPYISYYKKHKISPITKGIPNKEQYFMQRYFLYKTLGIPQSLKGLNIIEFGPGNGVNAVFTNSLQPKKYVLVDGNPVGIQNVRANLELHYSDLSNIEIHECLFQDFEHQPIYDLAICENALHGQEIQFVKMISTNVKERGILCITCNDAASILSEILRSLVGIIISNDTQGFDDKTKLLVKCFSPHLDALKFVGRNHVDWVHDNILNDINLHYPLNSIGDVIDCLSDEFVVHESSPRFFSDFRWYKSVKGREELFYTNAVAKESYLKNIINMMDYRLSHPPHSVDLGLKLLRCSDTIKTLSSQYAKSGSEETRRLIQEALFEQSRNLKNISPFTSEALEAYYEMFKSQNFTLGLSDPRLISWWGRGTQFLSLVKYG